MRQLPRQLACVLVVLALAGCQGTPAARAYKFRAGYVAVLTSIDELTVAGKVTPTQAKAIQQLRPIGDAAEKAVLANQSVGGAVFDSALAAAQSVLNQLIAIQLEAAQAKGGK